MALDFLISHPSVFIMVAFSTVIIIVLSLWKCSESENGAENAMELYTYHTNDSYEYIPSTNEITTQAVVHNLEDVPEDFKSVEMRPNPSRQHVDSGAYRSLDDFDDFDDLDPVGC